MIIVEDELGNPIECEVLFTYKNKERNEDYIVYRDKDKNIYSSIYNPSNPTEGLIPIEDDNIIKILDDIIEKLKF